MSKKVSLSQLKKQVPWQSATIKFKVLEIGDTSKLDDGRRVQQVIVADDTANVEVALWQEFVNSLSLGKSYQLDNLMVKTFNERISLFTPRQSVNIKQIDDLQNVVLLVQTYKKSQKMPRLLQSLISALALCAFHAMQDTLNPSKQTQSMEGAQNVLPQPYLRLATYEYQHC